MKSYNSNAAWKQLNGLLPIDFQIKEDNLPVEETWDWNGNKMHLDRYPNPTAECRIFLHHGVGTNGRQLNMIFGHKMAALGYEVVAMDNLGYGLTEVNQKDIKYEDWVQSFTDFINAENKRDYKKTILYGLSAGGMLVYCVACNLKEVHGIIGMCFLKNDDKRVQYETVKFPKTNWLALPLLRSLCSLGFGKVRIPIKGLSKMNDLVNNKEALEIFLADELSANSSVQLQFIYSLVTYQLPIPVTQFDKCPILLTQPEKDTWTPLAVSQISMEGIKAPFTIKILKDAGHYPMEEKGLKQLIHYADEFIKSLN